MTAEQFTTYRNAMGYTVPELAELLDVGERTIERIEAGEGCTVVMGLAMERAHSDMFCTQCGGDYD